jgi:hypothetical protein
MKAETKFIRKIQKLSENEEFQKRHIRNTEKDFKRTSKLRFSDVIMYSSRTENGPAQEYFVSLLMYNFSTCMFGSMQKDIPKKENTNTR